jgi:cytochrome bd-type quinol oxidase subunit 1
LVLTSLLVFAAVYTVLLAVDISLLIRSARAGLPADETGTATHQ